MLENDQSFIYEKDEDEVNLKTDRFNSEPNFRNSFNSFLNYSESNNNKDVQAPDILNKDYICETQKSNKETILTNLNANLNTPNPNNNNYFKNEAANISEKQVNKTGKRKNYIEEEGPKIISLDQVPLFRKLFISVHPFVLNGYRIHHTFKDCFLSMFKLHNETLNIWTHFLPFWGFLILAINLFSSN